jgi:predicted MFS family arabinose efflux permease
VLISLVGAINVLWLDAATFALSFLVLLIGLPRPRVSLAAAAAEGTTGVLEGARVVLVNPLLLRVTVAALMFGLFFPMLLAALPILGVARYDSDPNVVGVLFGSWGGGALVGTFVAMWAATRFAPMRLGALSGVALALPLWLLTLDLQTWQFAVVLALSGVFTPMLNAPLMTTLLTRTPEPSRAQAITFVMTANLLAGPLGYAAAGPVVEAWGVSRLLVIAAAGVSLAAMTLLSGMSGERPQEGMAAAEVAEQTT